MQSRAHYRKNHPIHPALVPFPLAFLLGAFVFDLVGRLTGIADLWVVGKYLSGIGVLAGLAAAVPGFIDYLGTVPPASSGKRHATRHMILNLSALALFAVSWWVRGGVGVSPDWPIVVLEGAGSLLLAWAGFIGGTLVFRNQIGVDHRYAGAGKWRERSFPAPPDGQGLRVAAADALETDQMELLHVGGRRIVLARTADGYVAFDDRCTHKGGSLAGGVTGCGVVHCPWHGSQFDVRTGEVRAGPAGEAIRTYRVAVEDGEVRLYL